MEHYNEERPHQGIGMVSPASRFAETASDGSRPLLLEKSEDQEPEGIGAPGVRARRKVSPNGRTRLVGRNYTVGRFLAGETVEAGGR